MQNNTSNKNNPIGITVTVKTSKGVKSFVSFETDYDEMIPIYNAVRNYGNVDEFAGELGCVIITQFENQIKPDYEFLLIAMQFVCTSRHHSYIISNAGNPMGIEVYLDVRNQIATLKYVDYFTWKNSLNKNIDNGGYAHVA
jgi:predicted component of type VI protein secretion system